jgi:ABC-type siderophore export system fused ATPase/permease subunit
MVMQSLRLCGKSQLILSLLVVAAASISSLSVAVATTVASVTYIALISAHRAAVTFVWMSASPLTDSIARSATSGNYQPST